jgi:hypothetical protein
MLEESLNRLDTWLERNGWAGYDPYDIKGTKLFIYLQRNRYTNFSSNYVLNQHPMFFRRLFRVRKQVNAKAMALFARAYLALYKKRNAPKYLEKALGLSVSLAIAHIYSQGDSFGRCYVNFSACIPGRVRTPR